ncbi:MAG: WD40 repeat domain-containing protein [Gemmataceae bacterium]
MSIFDAIKGKAIGELLHPGPSHVTGMAMHPNGTVACSRNNGTVCLWNLDKRAIVRTLDWKLGKLVSVAFSPDGNIGAAGTEDGQVVVWDVDE